MMRQEKRMSMSLMRRCGKVLSVWLIFIMLLSPLESFAAASGGKLHIHSDIANKSEKKSLFSNDKEQTNAVQEDFISGISVEYSDKLTNAYASTVGSHGNVLLGNVDAEKHTAHDEDIMLGNLQKTNVITSEVTNVQISKLPKLLNVSNQNSVTWPNMANVASVGGNSSTDFNSLLKGYVSWPEARETYAPLAGAEFTGKVTTTNHGTAEDAFSNYEFVTKEWVVANAKVGIDVISKPMLADIMTFGIHGKYLADGEILAGNGHVVTGGTVYDALYASVGNAFIGGNGLLYDSTNSKLISNVPLEVTNGTSKITLSPDGNFVVNDGIKDTFSVDKAGNTAVGGNMKVAGATELQKKAVLRDALIVAGDTTLQQKLDVTGATA
ncbi:MAG: hypothetical protein Q4C78_06270, partial [Synergistaceae bacterium]|nr:hypothetical protein [Synergistaceae bacterium]